jgi:hypothetical protein
LRALAYQDPLLRQRPLGVFDDLIEFQESIEQVAHAVHRFIIRLRGVAAKETVVIRAIAP